MTWFRVDDTFYDHPKVTSIPKRDRPGAVGLWLLAGAYCARHLTDGYISQIQASDMGGVPQMRALVVAGLWEPKDDGYVFHDWADYQPTRAQIMADRETWKARQARARRKKEGPPPDEEPPPE